MKKFSLISLLVLFVTGISFAQPPGGFGGGHPDGIGHLGDSLVCDSLGNPNHPQPGDSIACDSLGNPNHPFPGDSLWVDSLGFGGGHPWGGGHPDGMGHLGDSVACDSLGNPNHPFPSDSLWVDSLGFGGGHPWGGGHPDGMGHLGDSLACDSLGNPNHPFPGDSLACDSLGNPNHPHPDGLGGPWGGGHGYGICDSIATDTASVDVLTKTLVFLSEPVLYPNPVVNELNIQAQSNSSGDMMIRVFNYTGQVVLHRVLSVGEGVTTLKLSVENLPHGNYILLLEMSGERTTSRFVK